MLVLTRKRGQEIVVGERIRITVVEVRGKVVRLGIDAPEAVRVRRGELQPAEKTAAA
jgi:carbon storage regulator